MKGIRAGSFLHNLSFVFGAQMLVLIISVARAFILPKFLSVESSPIQLSYPGQSRYCTF